MVEVVPGIWHWSAVHPRHGQLAHSYYVADGGTLIDPMVPEDGLRAFEELVPGTPERALLTNRLHSRGCAAYVQAFGITVQCHEAGLRRFANDPLEVTGFRVGDTPAPHVTVHEVGAILPDEVALHIAVGPGALAVADGVVREADGRLAFVPDALLVDDPADAPGVKAGLRDSYTRIADTVDFAALLFAHGDPISPGGREALAAFAAGAD